jgi:hypothetical protein
MAEITIHIDHERFNFILLDCANQLASDKRMVMSLKRLGFEVEQSNILVPFEEATKISTLSEIQNLLSKFGFNKVLSKETAADVQSFEREERLFGEFSEKARTIRNNEFEEFPELVKDFEDFKDVLKQKIERRLYPLQLLSAFHMTFSQNACNFAVPGAGKTSIVYGAYTFLKQLPETDPRHVDRLLVIGPLSSFAPGRMNIRNALAGKSVVNAYQVTPLFREKKKKNIYTLEARQNLH